MEIFREVLLIETGSGHSMRRDGGYNPYQVDAVQ
jgi:hypothetical protein